MSEDSFCIIMALLGFVAGNLFTAAFYFGGGWELGFCSVVVVVSIFGAICGRHWL